MNDKQGTGGIGVKQMKTLWKEYGQTVITVLVAAMLLILCLWGFRIIGSGMERPAAGADVGNNMDGKMLKDIHSRQVPMIIMKIIAS